MGQVQAPDRALCQRQPSTWFRHQVRLFSRTPSHITCCRQLPRARGGAARHHPQPLGPHRPAPRLLHSVRMLRIRLKVQHSLTVQPLSWCRAHAVPKSGNAELTCPLAAKLIDCYPHRLGTFNCVISGTLQTTTLSRGRILSCSLLTGARPWAQTSPATTPQR